MGFFGMIKNAFGGSQTKINTPQIKITSRATDIQHMFSVNLSGVTDPNDIKNMTPELKALFKSQGISKKALRQNPEMAKKIIDKYKSGGKEAIEKELGVVSPKSKSIRKSRS